MLQAVAVTREQGQVLARVVPKELLLLPAERERPALLAKAKLGAKQLLVLASNKQQGCKGNALATKPSGCL